MIEWLLEPLRYGFVVRGLIAGILTGIACAVLSAFVVWRGMAFIGDAMAHAILPGIVLAFVVNIGLFFGALAAAVLAAIGIGLLTRRGALKEDTSIGVVFTGFFALGIVLLSRVTSYTDLTHILFGDILGVARSELIAMAAVVVLVVVLVIVFYKELLVTSFDPSHAVTIGLPPELVRYGLLLLIAFTVVTAVQTVGIVLVLALLVTPAATASLLAKKLSHIMSIGTAFAVAAVCIGFYASYYFDLASGAMIALSLSIMFILVFLLSRFRR